MTSFRCHAPLLAFFERPLSPTQLTHQATMEDYAMDDEEVLLAADEQDQAGIESVDSGTVRVAQVSGVPVRAAH
jgi:hypothetical protein